MEVDNNKINSEIVFINTLAQIAGFAVQSKYSKDKEMDLIKIDVDNQYLILKHTTYLLLLI